MTHRRRLAWHGRWHSHSLFRPTYVQHAEGGVGSGGSLCGDVAAPFRWQIRTGAVCASQHWHESRTRAGGVLAVLAHRSSTVLAHEHIESQHGFWQHDEPAIAGDRPASSPARARSGASHAHRRGSGSEDMHGNEHGPRRSRFVARRAGEVCTRAGGEGRHFRPR
eukprot:6090226-Prymnesium_polylepis.1